MSYTASEPTTAKLNARALNDFMTTSWGIPIMHLTSILQSNLFLVTAYFYALYTHEFRQPSTAFRKSFLINAWQSHDIQTGPRLTKRLPKEDAPCFFVFLKTLKYGIEETASGSLEEIFSFPLCDIVA